MYSDGLRTLKAANSFNSVVIPMAFCYQLTKDERYARRAIDDLMTVSSFPDYNPGHVIDMGMWLKGMGYAYDWCYDAMSDTERRTISDAIIKKGIEVINKAYYADLPAAVCLFGERGATHASASFFPKWKSNFTGYTQGGVILAALAVAEKAPDICFDTIEKAMRAWEYSNFGFYSDGAWVEGKTYQNVVNIGLADSMSACMTALGDTYNIPEYPGVRENLDVLMSLTSKVASFTYADDNARDPLAPINSSYSFFADYYNDSTLAQWRQNRIREKSSDWMDLAYYDKNINPDILTGVPTISYMASEFAVGAMYPPTQEGLKCAWFGQRGKINYSEIEKAKILTQLNVKHSALGIQSLVCELCQNDYPLELSLLRKSFDTAPVMSTNPNMAYYATRNTCTVLDGYEPSEISVECSDTEKLELYTMEKDGAKCVVMWTTHQVKDLCEGKAVDITVECGCKGARAYNLLNGEVAELNYTTENGRTVFKGIIVRDYPVVVEIDKEV